MAMYCFTLPGVCKILTIIVGSTAFGLGAYSYDETIVQEEFFLRTVQTALIISVIYFAIYLGMPAKLYRSDISLAIDIAFHVTAAVTLLIAGSLVIYSAVDNDRTYCHLIYLLYPHLFCQFYGIKMASGIATVLNGAIYWLTAATVFFSRPQAVKSSEVPSRQFRNPIFSIPTDGKEKKLGSEAPKMFYYGTKH